MHKPRKRPNAIVAGFFSIAAHAMIVGMLFISFNWQSEQPMDVAEVTLWDSIPQVRKQPVPELEPPPVVEEKPKPEPEAEPEVKPEPVEPPEKVVNENEIALKKKKEEERLKKEKLEKEKIRKQKLKKAKALKRKKALEKLKKDILNEKPNNDALKKLQETALADEKAANDAKAAAAKAKADASITAQYISKIKNKIRGHVNKSLCGTGKPVLTFNIGLLPTGQLSGSPSLLKSSGLAACDEAVERAILAAEPLPLPEDKSLFSKFRKLKLTFKPNE